MNTTSNEDEDAPLDPAVERVRARLARLLVISFGTMALGLVALLIAILYKSGVFGGGTEAPSMNAVAELPASAEVISSSVSGDTLAVTIRLPGGAQEVRLFRVPGGEPIGRVQFTSPAQ